MLGKKTFTQVYQVKGDVVCLHRRPGAGRSQRGRRRAGRERKVGPGNWRRHPDYGKSKVRDGKAESHVF